jgi:hypothetical protein
VRFVVIKEKEALITALKIITLGKTRSPGKYRPDNYFFLCLLLTESNFYRKQFSNASLQVKMKISAPIQVHYF